MSTGRGITAKVRVLRIARVACLVAGAAVAVPHLIAAAAGVAPLARLVGVSASTDGAATAVVIETSEPVGYSTAQPDPMTVLVDLRNVSADGVAAAAGRTGVVSDVRVETARANDGVSVARVRLSLTRPGKPVVRSRWNTVVVEFGGRTSGAAQPAVSSPAARQAPAKPAQKPAAAPAAVSQPGVSGRLSAIDVSSGPDGTRVHFGGVGAFTTLSLAAANGLPARLVIDFADVTPGVAAATPVGKGPVDRIRVALYSRQPLVTRAVIDLKYVVAHRIQKDDAGLTVVLEPSADVQASPRPVVVAAPKPAAAAPSPAAAKPDAASGDWRALLKPVPSSGQAPVQTPAPVVVPPVPKPAPVVTPPAPAAAPPSATPVPQAPAPAVQAPAVAAAPAPPVPSDPKTTQVVSGDQPVKKYTGHLVSFDFQQADLRAVLRSFTEISGLNVIVDESISGTVDVVLKDVPWDQALEIILTSKRLGYIVENNVVRIAPLDTLAAEESANQKLKDAQAITGQLKVLTRTLSYAKAKDMAVLLKGSAVNSVLTKRGDVQVDERTNTLIISDLPAAVAVAADLITSLDRPEPQVEIEARIVQTSRDSARALGVQWGFSGQMNGARGNTTGLTFPATVGVEGRTGGTQGSSSGSPSQTVGTGVNLGAATPTSALGLALGTLNGAFNLDIALSALVHKGNAKVISQPRVMMQNNFEAQMVQGVQIPIQTVSNNTVTVSFKDAALTMKVKPQITASDTIILDLFLENASPDYSRSVNGIPPIDTQRAVSQVLVKDSETIVIGGIMTSSETGSKEGVPGLSKIPLLGWLFKRNTVSDQGRELLIFITPKIRR